MRRISWKIFFIFLLLINGGKPSVADQKHFNKGLIFEENFENGRNNMPNGWKAIGGNGINLEWSSIEKNSGLRSVEIKSSSNESSGGWLYQTILIKGGVEYRISYRVKLSNVTSIDKGANLVVKFYSERGDNLGIKESPYLKGSTNWSVYTMNFITPSNANKIELILKMDSAQGKVWYDDIVICEKNETPTFGFAGEFKK